MKNKRCNRNLKPPIAAFKLKSMERTKANIKNHGLHVIKVLEDENNPPFGYSIGLFETYRHPEILIIGLKLDFIHSLINTIADEIKEGTAFENGKYYSEILDDFNCYFTTVENSHYEEYVQQAINFYKGSDFPLLQCIYPTVKNIYPWQMEWPADITHLQPVLGKAPNN